MLCLAADLHVHTALSPCAAQEMTPRAIIARAADLELAMIAICDHNSAGNAAAAQAAAAAARGRPVAVLAGMEITTAEEIHVLGLFPEAAPAEAAGREVQAALPLRARENPRLLSIGCGLGLAEAVALIHGRGGLAIASHVDRPSHGVLAQLGLFPPDAGFDAVEVSAAGARRVADRGMRIADWQAEAGIPAALPVLCGSDAHSLDEMGAGRSLLEVHDATFAELALALRGSEGRGCRCA